MLVLNATDEIRGHSDTAGVVHYTIHGLVDGVLTQLAFGLLPDVSTALYTAVATPTVVKTVTMVNKDAVVHTVDLDFVALGAGQEYCLIAEDMELGAYHAFFTDFEKVTVLSEEGAVIFGYIDHIHAQYALEVDLTAAIETQERVTYSTDDPLNGSEAGKMVEFNKLSTQSAVLTAGEWSAGDWFNWRVLANTVVTFSSDVTVYSLDLILTTAGQFAEGTVSFDGSSFYISGGLSL